VKSEKKASDAGRGRYSYITRMKKKICNEHRNREGGGRWKWEEKVKGREVDREREVRRIRGKGRGKAEGERGEKQVRRKGKRGERREWSGEVKRGREGRRERGTVFLSWFLPFPFSFALPSHFPSHFTLDSSPYLGIPAERNREWRISASATLTRSFVNEELISYSTVHIIICYGLKRKEDHEVIVSSYSTFAES
jgi:hypothetical protein